MMTIVTSDFTVWLRTVQPQIEESLEQACVGLEQSSASPRLASGIRYALMSGGKRVRPGLTVLVSAAVGGSYEDAVPAALACEMIHAYSLVHDDLPCMDDDSLRRGQPTVHVSFDQATAVLVGDGLQSAAFATLSAQPDAVLAKAQAEVLAHACGGAGMVGGQQLDMDAESLAATVTTVALIHRAKTGILLEAAIRLGALSGGADDAAWAKWGGLIGALFQATDDILDATSTTNELGKTAGKDQAVGKATLVTVLGLEQARSYADDLAQDATQALADLRITSHHDVLTDIPNFLLMRSQ